MTHTRTTALLSAVLLAAALAPARAHAEPGMPWGGPMGGPVMGPPGMGAEAEPGMMLGTILRGLALAPDQQAKVHTIMEGHRPRFRELFGQLRAANEGMASRLLATGPLRLEDLTPQIQQVTRLREQLMEEGTRVALDLRGVLTPEQLAKAAEVAQRLQALHAEMKKLVGEPGMPPP